MGIAKITLDLNQQLRSEVCFSWVNYISCILCLVQLYWFEYNYVACLLLVHIQSSYYESHCDLALGIVLEKLDSYLIHEALFLEEAGNK